MTNDKLAKLRARQAQLAAKIRQEENRERFRERKDDTRRKILAGAAILDEAERNPECYAALIKLLGRFLSRPDDRALFGLVPAEKPEEPPAISQAPLPSPEQTGDAGLSDERSHASAN